MPNFTVSPKNLILNHNDIKRSSLSSSTSSNQPAKRSIHKILSVKAALNVKMRTTSISPLDNMLMMSVELENNSETKNSFSIESINVHIVNGFIRRYEWNLDDDSKVNYRYYYILYTVMVNLYILIIYYYYYYLQQ